MGSHAEFKVKWVVTVCLGGQKPLWVSVRSDAGNMGCEAWKTRQVLINRFSVCQKETAKCFLKHEFCLFLKSTRNAMNVDEMWGHMTIEVYLTSFNCNFF